MYTHMCRDLCVDMCVDIRVDMCGNMCGAVCMHVWVCMRVGMHTLPGATSARHNYIGHNYIGRLVFGHACSHNYIGHNYIGRLVFEHVCRHIRAVDRIPQTCIPPRGARCSHKCTRRTGAMAVSACRRLRPKAAEGEHDHPLSSAKYIIVANIVIALCSHCSV